MYKMWLVLLLALTMSISSCAQNGSQTNNAKTEKTNTPTVASTDKNADKNEDCPICNYDFSKYEGQLTKDEIGGLLLALNDEYRATSIYEQINKDFNDPRPFVNIVQAEMRHASRLKDVFTTYKIAIPENPWTGKVPKFASVAEACKAGVDAEIANSDLYDKILNSTKREDILVVYRALQRASVENHLPAFKRCGEGGGGGRGGRGGGRFN